MLNIIAHGLGCSSNLDLFATVESADEHKIVALTAALLAQNRIKHLQKMHFARASP